MLDLTKEQNALFYLLSGRGEIDDAVDWDVVKHEAINQAVFLNASTSKFLPEEIKKKWKQTHYEAALMNLHSFHAFCEMERIMRVEGYPYVILKGLSAARFYPAWSCRMLGDVDFLIDSNQKELVENSLESEGYVRSDSKHPFHVGFSKPHQHLEMHFDISGVPHGKKGEIVHEYMAGVLSETVSYSIKDREFHVPSSKYHGLILLLHMQRHMLATGIGLRHLMDWCYFVDSTYQDDFWRDDLLPILKKIGLFYYAKVLTKIGAIYLGSVMTSWCADVDDEICDNLMEDIIISGNFGIKDKVRADSGVLISSDTKNGTNHGMLQNIFAKVCEEINLCFPIVNHFHILYPFFIIRIALRWIFRVMTGERVSILLSSKYVNERKKVYNKLKIFEN